MSVAKRARRRERRDVASLSVVAARRALRAPGAREDRGAYYVVPGHEDDPMQVHRVTHLGVTLRSRSGGFSFFGPGNPPETEWWCVEVPKRTSDEAREVLEDYDRRRRSISRR